MINYANAIKKMELLMVELLSKGINVPEHISAAINSARNMTLVYERSPAELEAAMDKSPLLQNAEIHLLMLAEMNVDKDYADGWQRQIIDAYQEPITVKPKHSRYISGVPKGDHVVRLKCGDIDEKIDKLIKQSGLGTKAQDDGYLLVHGGKEDVKSLLSDIRETIKPK